MSTCSLGDINQRVVNADPIDITQAFSLLQKDNTNDELSNYSCLNILYDFGIIGYSLNEQ